MGEVRILPDSKRLAIAAAKHFVVLAKEAIGARGLFSVALAGGSTPRAAYALLATEEYAERIDWSRVHVFWGDERCVPPDNTDSNYRMARETLLDGVPLLAQNVHRVRGEMAPEDAASDYEYRLRQFFGDDLPRFDLVLLGMGGDGHTASLFPGTAALCEQRRWAVAHYVDSVRGWRVTLTPVVINGALNVTFIVSGEAKAERMAQVLKGPYPPEALPAQLISPVDGRLLWLLDAEAAALLEPQPSGSHARGGRR